MPTTPLSSSISSILRSDSTAALAALMVIASAHAELFSWAARMVCAAAPARVDKIETLAPKAKGNGAAPHGARPPAARKASTNAQPKSNGTAAHLTNRRKAPDRDDENLHQAMRDSPEGPIGDWAEAIGKSRTSVVSGLHRLRDAGFAESVEGRWRLTEEPAPREPARRWVAPLSAASRAHV